MTALDERVHAALATVRDPELDEPLTDLGFVASVAVDGGTVHVDLRLPTYFCAPNFAWIMAEDARRAVAAVPGVTAVDIRLVDHHASAQINAGVSRDARFQEAFAGLADGGLSDLRVVFRRKAMLARQHRLVAGLRRRGIDGARLCALRIGDLDPEPELEVYLQRRAELDLPVAADAPVVITVDGQAVAPEDLDAHLARIRAVAVSLEANAGFCRGLLATRYAAETKEAT